MGRIVHANGWGMGDKDRDEAMNDLDLLDCQPWQLTASLFGKKDHQKMQDMASIKQMRSARK